MKTAYLILAVVNTPVVLIRVNATPGILSVSTLGMIEVHIVDTVIFHTEQRLPIKYSISRRIITFPTAYSKVISPLFKRFYLVLEIRCSGLMGKATPGGLVATAILHRVVVDITRPRHHEGGVVTLHDSLQIIWFLILRRGNLDIVNTCAQTYTIFRDVFIHPYKD